jgi:hypothetical protein
METNKNKGRDWSSIQRERPGYDLMSMTLFVRFVLST